LGKVLAREAAHAAPLDDDDCDDDVDVVVVVVVVVEASYRYHDRYIGYYYYCTIRRSDATAKEIRGINNNSNKG